jgi:hypothetical protein
LFFFTGEPSKPGGQSSKAAGKKDDENKENKKQAHSPGKADTSAGGAAQAGPGKVVFPTVVTPADYLDSDEEEENKKEKAATGAGKQKTPVAKPAAVGGAAAKPRAACRYGAACYRKNPQHFQVEAHPGDADYAEPEEGGEDDKRPECEYGLGCYRKNPDHKRRYKHTRRPQPKRKAKVGWKFIYCF